jgi:DNA-binding NarL/FixJ family response regulator
MPPRQPLPEPAPADRPRVVLMDPAPDQRVRTTHLLVADGCVVVAAVGNYAQAIVAARRDQPTVIVTELHAGQLMAPDAYIAALMRLTDAPVIIYTAEALSASEVAEWGVWVALVKGASPTALVDAVVSAHFRMRRPVAR